uniref:Uncharacterized protein n=1 Tax=Podoviridae sp. ctpVv1 TaxID=2827748 RepID=A0A8S5T2S0_9CAUD|nr:MAG TPA: hypothetical protein [Podoviridae sp. ctpVv1]
MITSLRSSHNNPGLTRLFTPDYVKLSRCANE